MNAARLSKAALSQRCSKSGAAGAAGTGGAAAAWASRAGLLAGVGAVACGGRVAFAGVEIGDWVDPTGETRDVAVRLHPQDRVDASNIERLLSDPKVAQDLADDED